MIRLEEETHTYWNEEGREIPGVTHMLETLGIYRKNPFWAKHAAPRGSAVHKAAALICKSPHTDSPDTIMEVPLSDGRVMDLSQTHEAIVPYIRGVLRYQADTGFVATEVEVRVYSREWNFAGTTDAVYIPDAEHYIEINDWKCGDMAPLVSYQLGLYGVGLGHYTGDLNAVRLPGNGKYEVKSFDLEAIRPKVLAAAAIFGDIQNAFGKQRRQAK